MAPPWIRYWPGTNENLGQGNVFTSVCHSVHRRGLSLCPGWGVSVKEGLCQGEPPRTVKSGRYASYWNAFLFFNNSARFAGFSLYSGDKDKFVLSVPGISSYLWRVPPYHQIPPFIVSTRLNANMLLSPGQLNQFS